jgi:hypothetical protein
MHAGLDDEEYRLLQTIVDHYARQLFEARDVITDLRQQLATANERLELLEASAYGVCWL